MQYFMNICLRMNELSLLFGYERFIFDIRNAMWRHTVK
jgi:hypothetical protein